MAAFSRGCRESESPFKVPPCSSLCRMISPFVGAAPSKPKCVAENEEVL